MYENQNKQLTKITQQEFYSEMEEILNETQDQTKEIELLNEQNKKFKEILQQQQNEIVQSNENHTEIERKRNNLIEQIETMGYFVDEFNNISIPDKMEMDLQYFSEVPLQLENFEINEGITARPLNQQEQEMFDQIINEEMVIDSQEYDPNVEQEKSNEITDKNLKIIEEITDQQITEEQQIISKINKKKEKGQLKKLVKKVIEKLKQ